MKPTRLPNVLSWAEDLEPQAEAQAELVEPIHHLETIVNYKGV